MSDPLLELISLAVANLDQVPNSERRAEILESAGSILASNPRYQVQRDQIRATAAILREADNAQLQLTRLLSPKS